VSLRLIDELDREIGDCERELHRLGADHRYVPLLPTVPGIGWVLAYTIAAELGDIERFASPRKLAGYSGRCPRVYQSGSARPARPLFKQGPKHLRWALVEAGVQSALRPLRARMEPFMELSRGERGYEGWRCSLDSRSWRTRPS
jgi:transposase